MVAPTNQTGADGSPLTGPDLTTSVVVAPNVSAAAAPIVSVATDARQVRDTPTGGFEKEDLVWEARYSAWNFLLRSIAAALLTVISAVFAFEVWDQGGSNYRVVARLLGIAAAVFWVYLAFRLIRALYGHHYRLTTRRLFVANGFFRRRVDQIELIRIKDLYLQQTMVNWWLNIGTVVVVSSEPTLPKASLLGIRRPQLVMDMIWQHTRREQDRKATAIEQI
jgi:hypothetical protein